MGKLLEWLLCSEGAVAISSHSGTSGIVDRLFKRKSFFVYLRRPIHYFSNTEMKTVNLVDGSVYLSVLHSYQLNIINYQLSVPISKN